MKRSYLLCLSTIVFVASVGCSGSAGRTGFLSDYSKLQKDDDGAMRYVNEATVGKFDRYLVDPVTVHFHDKSKGKDADPKKVAELEALMHSAMVREISDGYEVVGKPGPGVARLRVALTDLKKDSPALNVLPQTRLTGAGLGKASMEAELIDTETGEQIAAVIQTRKGSAVSLEGLSDWSSAKAAINKWAKDFRSKVDEAHGR